MIIKHGNQFNILWRSINFLCLEYIFLCKPEDSHSVVLPNCILTLTLNNSLTKAPLKVQTRQINMQSFFFRPRTFAAQNFLTHGTFAPQERLCKQLSFPGTFAPVELSLPYLKKLGKAVQQSVHRRMLVNVRCCLLEQKC